MKNDENTPIGGRRQPKRKATTMKNSKYDESNYLVDFSGKHRRIDELTISKHQSTTERQSQRGQASKRSIKMMKKQKVTESTVLDQIKEIKINEGELGL
jgi:hypothetical protein